MTATTTTAFTSDPIEQTVKPRVGRTGIGAGVVAAGATTAFAAIVHAAGVPFTIGDKAIPLGGFAQLTLACAIVGTVLAVALARRARRPRHTFLVTTVALTLASFVPDVVADAHTATKVALVCTHVVAALIVVPALASKLSD